MLALSRLSYTPVQPAQHYPLTHRASLESLERMHPTHALQNWRPGVYRYGTAMTQEPGGTDSYPQEQKSWSEPLSD